MEYRTFYQLYLFPQPKALEGCGYFVLLRLQVGAGGGMLGNVSFRKLSPNQLRYYWAVNFYDIEEPVFIADNGVYKLLIQVSPTTNKIIWIDEVFD